MDGFVANDSPYFSPAERTKEAAFTTAWREMVRDQLAPAFGRYQTFLRDEYLPHGAGHCRGCGAAERRGLLSRTAARADHAERHRGRGSQDGTRGAGTHQDGRAAIAQRLFNNPDLDTALCAVASAGAARWDNREAVIAHARCCRRPRPGGDAAVLRPLPKTAVIVTPVPAAEEPTTADRYQAGTIDGKRPAEYPDQCRPLARPAKDRSRGRRLSRRPFPGTISRFRCRWSGQTRILSPSSTGNPPSARAGASTPNGSRTR